MASEMMEALMLLCQEKHIDELYLLDRLEQSLAKSYADVLHLDFGARVTIDRATGRVYVYEFRGRIGDIITGTVLQSTPDFTIIKIREGVEAELPHFDQRRFPDERDERPAGERYLHNQRIKAIIVDVRDPNATQPAVRGERQRPPIVVSRTHPDLIRRLFELEVPEVYDGVVSIRSIAREAGVRSKIAVSSVDERLDPVGACVGPKGSRVRTVVSELRGERVDVVPWFDDAARCVASALSPARVSRVIVDGATGHATVIVPDDQLSLAIGKEGQNARLAARLTGLHIDIKNESLAASILNNLPEVVEETVDEEEIAHRCKYVSPNGTPCRNMARPGSDFCGIHDDMENAEISSDPDSLI